MIITNLILLKIIDLILTNDNIRVIENAPYHAINKGITDGARK
jgi:hypothetical protein